jgi:hypothetical protein
MRVSPRQLRITAELTHKIGIPAEQQPTRRNRNDSPAGPTRND